jgi:hypothetical protein
MSEKKKKTLLNAKVRFKVTLIEAKSVLSNGVNFYALF